MVEINIYTNLYVVFYIILYNNYIYFILFTALTSLGYSFFNSRKNLNKEAGIIW